jgi:hypothetical protein
MAKKPQTFGKRSMLSKYEADVLVHYDSLLTTMAMAAEMD